MSRLPPTAEEILSFSANPSAARADLAQFEEVYDKTTGKKIAWKSENDKILLRIFGNSPALTQRLINDPKAADEILKSKYLTKRKTKGIIANEIDSIARNINSGDAEMLGRELRKYKYREMTRLVANDLAGNADIHGMLEEWSDISSAIIDRAYAFTFEKMRGAFGKPAYRTDEGRKLPCTGAVIAIGKLGAEELNLSSDIDIIVLYASDNGRAESKDGNTISNHEFFVKLTAQMTRLISEVTEDGFLFRVDHELRPEGNSGALANSLDAAERYYEYFGHSWERQALIRAKPVAGDLELGRKFIDSIRPFIYRRSISIGDLSHMRETKLRMESKAASRKGAYDIKVGKGGIREIEFFVQALQQLYGGNLPRVRCTNTFDAIDSLSNESLIHHLIAKQLRAAYAFLRRTENMLQVENDLQTHTLPSEGGRLAALAKRMGLRSDKFLSELEEHTANVEKAFHALFEADYDLQELEEALRANLMSCQNEEEEADSLAWFKQQESKRIQHLDLDKKIPLPMVLKRQSLLADVLIGCAWDLARRPLMERYGTPKAGHNGDAGFAIIGMGKLGSLEMDYGSDLDLCFLYSGPGRTEGRRSISNVEFFTKLAQKIISKLSLPTRYGRAYVIDSELRPSGHSGALVATLDSFKDYHTKKAQIWERLALLRARTIAGDENFIDEVRSSLSSLAYGLPPPPASQIRTEIERLQKKTKAERTRERPGLINLKTGDGGLSDLESVIQYYHLLHAGKCQSLHTQNTFDVVDALGNEGIIDDDMRMALKNLLFFYRGIISKLRLIVDRQVDIIDINSDYIERLAELAGHASTIELMKILKNNRAEVVNLYDGVIRKNQKARGFPGAPCAC